jgi:hypothetical protein
MPLGTFAITDLASPTKPSLSDERRIPVGKGARPFLEVKRSLNDFG